MSISRARAHPRRTKSGKVAQVRQFERRFKEGRPVQPTRRIKAGIPPALARKIRRRWKDKVQPQFRLGRET